MLVLFTMNKNKELGKIDISALIVPPEKHEYETARFFAMRGIDITFIKPSYLPGHNTPDFSMRSKDWEAKSPITYAKYSFERNLRKAAHQSPNIIFDLRRLNRVDEEKYIKELRKWCNYGRINTLIVIRSNNTVLTIKGKFDIM